MSDFKLDGRKWKFLDSPDKYIGKSDLKQEPLERQFKTAKEILQRFQQGRGVLLADDVGLGKTTVGALVAWVTACQDKRVRIYAPNDVLRRRWAEELERHVPMLASLGANEKRIRQGDVDRLKAGQIQVATHSKLVKSHSAGKQKTTCDLMIVDEAHRAKGEQSKFKAALSELGNSAKRKLILTATPFSIDIEELVRMLQFAGATELEAVRCYASQLKRLYSLGDGHDDAAETKSLVSAAEAAVDELQPYLIRHGIDDLSPAEQKHFDAGVTRWDIATPPASTEDIQLLLRMDRLLQLAPERKGERRNDPRFHIGWRHVGTALERAEERCANGDDHIAAHHIEEAKKALSARRTKLHPKIAAVSEAIQPLLDDGEKVLVFCHHRATAAELLTGFERSLKAKSCMRGGPPEDVWRAAWESFLPNDDDLVVPIIDWLCTPGIRGQVSRWLGEPAMNPKSLTEQLLSTRPRHAVGFDVPTIADAAVVLAKTLLDEQSKSTRALLKNMLKKSDVVGASHFPGRLDDGFCVMGAWDHDREEKPKTLYTGKPDIVLALFNSPFGPDVLVTTDRLSEGVDLHRCCRHLIHYELDPSPVRTLQRNGRIRRVSSWAALTKKPICYAYPAFGGTRDEKAVGVMQQRINAFGLLLGGVPSLGDGISDSDQNFAEKVLSKARKKLESLSKRLCVPG